MPNADHGGVQLLGAEEEGSGVTDDDPPLRDATPPPDVTALPDETALLDLVPVVRRVVAARIRDPHTVEDLVQETLARVMAARTRIEGDSLAPYAVVTARNLVASLVQRDDRARRHAHLLVDETDDAPPDQAVLRHEERTTVGRALGQLSDAERAVLLAHEVEGRDTASLAASHDSTPGAIAAQLNRTRAKLRVEYLLAQEHLEPPTDRCRPVLYALSSGDRRRQRALDVGEHLLACETCAGLGAALLERRPQTPDDNEVRVPVRVDADVVTARREGRAMAARAGLPPTQLTVIATAISEVARNIVKFAHHGEIVVSIVSQDGRTGVTVLARDTGPGIPDVGRALEDGYSTYAGLGLGLPGTRRLMDEFDIVSEVGKGTTVTMTKWL